MSITESEGSGDERATATPRGESAWRAVRVTFLFVAIWCAVGVVVYPEWWYGLVFDGKYRLPSYWGEGNLIAMYNTISFFFPALFTIWAILSFSNSNTSSRLQKLNQRVVKALSGKTWYFGAVIALGIVFAVGLYFTGPRTKQMRDLQTSLEKSTRELKETLEKIKTTEVPPLSDPTSFAYIDTAEVESLYGQNEPELLPTLVKKKIEDSRKGDASVMAGEYFKTDIGLSEVRSEEQELKATEKNPQRKLKDLIDFLYEQKKLRRYGLEQTKPEELKKLDDATSLLSRYGVVSNETKLRSVRDRLFSEELNRLENELSTLHGLVLVDGDWTVARTNGGYVFRAPVIEHISSPLSFEFRLNDNDMQPKTKEIIETFKSRPIRLTAFGNVIAGASASDQNVRIVPVAVY
jgi:hypothetical protein